MSTLTKSKPAKKPVKSSKPVPTWIGSGKGKAFVRAGVDLTKPSLPPGKHL